MLLRVSQLVAGACVLGSGSVAVRSLAADVEEAPQDCPPEEWFCAPASSPNAEPEAPAAPPVTAPPPASAAVRAPPDAERAPTSEGPGELSVDGQEPFPFEDNLPRWSVQLRAQGILLGAGQHDQAAALGGAGASLRYAVHPTLSLDLGVDGFVGRDYNGYQRGEASLSASALFYLSPEPSVRSYVLVGANLSAAHVDVAGDEQVWGYIGGQAGLGLEFPLATRWTLNVDFLGFIRGRLDARAAQNHEFSNAEGNATNTSGGGVFRVGVALYF